jgi:hypothetical protein
MKKNSFPTIGFVAFSLLITMVVSCGKKVEKKPDEKKYLTGRYVNNTVLMKMADTIPGGVPYYCLEINFTKPDSVTIETGFEVATLAYKQVGDHYSILGASQLGDMNFMINADSSLVLVDSAWTEVHSNSAFKKVPNENGRDWVFEKYVNEAMVAGEYVVYAGEKPTTQKVQFTADGKVTGLQNYRDYSVCYSGDCVGTTIPLSNTMLLGSTDGQLTEFAFQLNKKQGTLQLYALEEPKPDVKGERKIKELVFDLRK